MADIGDVDRLTFEVSNASGALTDPAKILLRILQPDGTVQTLEWVTGEEEDIIRDSIGKFHFELKYTESGRWDWKWQSEGTVETATSDHEDVVPDAFGTSVTDLRDTRVLIPRIRRRLEGAIGTGRANAEASQYTDDQVNGMIADAVADVILYSGGLWGHQLQVVARDDVYLAPVAWMIDPALTEDEAVVIDVQATLNHIFQDLKSLKVSETIRDEATEWSYQLSANALTEYLKMLRKLRDDAIERILASEAPADGWVNLLAVRDQTTDALIEPWSDYGGGGGQLFNDPRFC